MASLSRTPIEFARSFAQRPDGKAELVVRVRDGTCRIAAQIRSGQLRSAQLGLYPVSQHLRSQRGYSQFLQYQPSDRRAKESTTSEW